MTVLTGYAVGRLLLDPFSSLLFSTNAEYCAAVSELQSQGYEIAEAIELILQQRNAK